jgi:hypothetical protein
MSSLLLVAPKIEHHLVWPGKWTLEIHNDAYSTWLSDAKFFRWSLKLYGTQSDPNSDNAEGKRGQNVVCIVFNLSRIDAVF